MNKIITYIMMSLAVIGVVWGASTLADTYLEVPDDGWVGVGVAKERIVFDDDGNDIELLGGNVGIGTTAPDDKLEVTEGSIYIDSAISSREGIYFQEDDTNFHFGLLFNGTGSADTNTLEIVDESYNALMSIKRSGKVGIGTTAPGDYEDGWDNLVIKSSGNTGMTIQAGASNEANLGFGNSTGTSTRRGAIAYVMIPGANDDKMFFKTATTNRVVIDKDGKVGIGTTTPNQTLSVIGTGYFSGNVYIAGTLTGGSPMFFGDDPNSAEYFGTDENFYTECKRDKTGKFILIYYDNGAEVKEYDAFYCNYWYAKKQAYNNVIDEFVEVNNNSRKITYDDFEYKNGKWAVKNTVKIKEKNEKQNGGLGE